MSRRTLGIHESMTATFADRRAFRAPELVQERPTAARPATEVVRLAPAQVRAAGHVLARAFHDDPLFQYALPDPAQRARALPGPFRSLLRFGLREGAVHTTPDARGAAIWVAPGSYPVRTVAALRAGFPLWPVHLGRAGMARIERYLAAWDAAHARAVPGLHWYLWVLGVDTPHQGRGLGTALMQPILQRADMQGVPCYLETTQPRNLPLYRRHGFEVVEEIALDGGAPPSWAMRREPVPARAGNGAA